MNTYSGRHYLSLQQFQEFFSNLTLDVNNRDEDGETYLFRLKRGEAVPITLFLLEKGIDVNIVNDNEENALFHLSHLSQEEEYQVAKLLIENGINVNNINILNKNVLFYSKNPLLVKLLIDNGINVNQVGETSEDSEDPDVEYYTTPIFFHLREKDLAILKILVEAGADVTSLTSNKRTVLFNISDDPNGLVTSYLLENGLKDLINHTDLNGDNALVKYSNLGVKAISILLDNGIDINNLNINKQHSYFYLSDLDNPQTVAALELMIQHYPEGINLRDSNGITSLMISVDDDNISEVLFLLKHDADINIINNLGQNALFYVNSVAMTKLLIDNDININQVNHDNKNALYYVDLEIASYLVENYIDFTQLYLPISKILGLTDKLKNFFKLLLWQGMNIENFHSGLSDKIVPRFLSQERNGAPYNLILMRFLGKNGHSSNLSVIERKINFETEDMFKLTVNNISLFIIWCKKFPQNIPVYNILKKGSIRYNSILFYHNIFPKINIFHEDLSLGEIFIDELWKCQIIGRLMEIGNEIVNNNLIISITEDLTSKEYDYFNKLIAPLIITSLYLHPITQNRIIFHESEDIAENSESFERYHYFYENSKKLFFHYFTVEEILQLLQLDIETILYNRLKKNYLDQRKIKDILQDDYEGKSLTDVIKQRYPGMWLNSLSFLWNILFEK